MTDTVFESYNHTNQVVWELEYNGMKVRVIKKKNKHGILLDKTYMYTNGGGAGYYETTAFAVFGQKFWMERLLGVKLRLKEFPNEE